MSTQTNRNSQSATSLDVEREGEPLGVPREQLGDVLLVERHLAAAQRVDLLGHDVADHDLVAELGEARARDEADPAGAEDPDLRSSRRAEPTFRLLGV